MNGHLVVVGDPVADHLVPALAELAARDGWAVRVVDPLGLADLPLTVDERSLHVHGRRVDAVVFRLSLDLLVAPGFGEDDRSFATNELRAVWAHALSLPGVATPNRGAAAHSLLRDPFAWCDRLAVAGVPVAPRRIGTAPPGSCWAHPDGTLGPLPPPQLVRTLGIATVPARAWRPVVCCAGQVEPDVPRSLAAAASRVARHLAAAGVGLAEVALDQLGRVLAVSVHPVISGEHAGWAAGALLASFATHVEDLPCCS